MRNKLLALALAATAAGCATSERRVPPPPPPPPSAPAFEAASFEWSRAAGVAAIRGTVGYRGAAGAYGCKGAIVALTPDTPYSRRRILRLYGSADRAAVPVSVVRSRQSSAPSDAFSKF